MLGFKYLTVIFLVAPAVLSQSQQPANARQGLGCVLAPPTAATSGGGNSKSDSAQPAATTEDTSLAAVPTEAAAETTTNAEAETPALPTATDAPPAPQPIPSQQVAPWRGAQKSTEAEPAATADEAPAANTALPSASSAVRLPKPSKHRPFAKSFATSESTRPERPLTNEEEATQPPAPVRPAARPTWAAQPVKPQAQPDVQPPAAPEPTDVEQTANGEEEQATPPPAPIRPAVQSTWTAPAVKPQPQLPTVKDVVTPPQPTFSPKKAVQWAAQNDKSGVSNQREGKAAKNNVQLLQANAPAPVTLTVPKKPSKYVVPGAIFVAGEQDAAQGTSFTPGWKDQTTVNAQGSVWDALDKLRGRTTLSAGEVQEILSRAVAGTDYPTYSYVPNTKFSCEQVNQPGYYADPDTQCQVIRRCDANGLKWNYLCPNSTLFNQITLTCDWYFNVDCSRTSQYYDYSNSRLYHSDLFFLDSPAQ